MVTDGVVALIVIDPAPTPTLMMPAPEIDRLLLCVPVDETVVLPAALMEMVLKLVTLGVVALIVILPAPTPTDTIPAPDTFSSPENVPADDEVVLPSAVSDWLIVCTLAEMVMVDALEANPIPAPATSDTELVDPFSVKFDVAAVTAYETVPPVVVMPRPAPAEYSGPKMDRIFDVVLLAPGVVD